MKLAQREGCLACHALRQPQVGPAWRDVAQRYRNDPDAEAWLFHKVRNGGNGRWGEVMQPPNTTTPDAELRRLIRFVLSR